MNAMHDWRYVHPGDLQSFPVPHEKTRLAAFSIDGSIGSDWMTDYGVTYLDPVMKAHFMHAGLDHRHSIDYNETLGIGFMEKLLGGHRAGRDWTPREHDFWSNTGPMWYRGYALLSEEEACIEASKAMKELNADFLVMGHTPSYEHAVVRCGGRVLLIDTGLSTAYGGRPVVLEMRKKKTGETEVRFHYDDTKERSIIEVLPLAW
jgi:cleavage and polyadenylation specificity factor subunit 3